MAVRLQRRRGTAAAWTAEDPVLSDGEIGLETDTLTLKVGDGVTAWTSLPYYNSSSGNLYGAGVPGAGLGFPGNTYWDTTNKDFYVKDPVDGWTLLVELL